MSGESGDPADPGLWEAVALELPGGRDQRRLPQGAAFHTTAEEPGQGAEKQQILSATALRPTQSSLRFHDQYILAF